MEKAAPFDCCSRQSVASPLSAYVTVRAHDGHLEHIL